MSQKLRRKDDKFIGSVKVGSKGQIVLPKEIRDMFDIEPGDTLLIMADRKKGIALERSGIFSKIADAILSGKGREMYPDYSDEDTASFAGAIKDILNDEE